MEAVSNKLPLSVTLETTMTKEAAKAQIPKLLVEFCNELDEDFLMEHDCPDGSTAIIALVLGTDLFIANLGRVGHFAWTRLNIKPGS